MATPNLMLAEYPQGSLQPSTPYNDAMQALDALVQLSVQTITNTPPTTTSADVGKLWLIGTAPTGVWSGKANQIALCTAENTWRYFPPLEGWYADIRDLDLLYRYTGTAWQCIHVSPENVQTGTSYTLALTDAFRLVTMNNSSANTLTVPPNSSVAFPVGTRIDIGQDGAGQTTVVADTGVTIRSPETLKLRKQWAKATLIKRGTDTWDIEGNLEKLP